MTTRERTAYPRFKQSITADELTEFYTPTDEELALVQQHAKGDIPRLAFAVLLKCFQKLGIRIDQQSRHISPSVF